MNHASGVSTAPWQRRAAEPQRGDRVVVGVSGGVDSAVAAHRLAERGCDVVAVTTKNFCFDDIDPALATGSCCSLDAFETARAMCAELGVSHTTLDVSDAFAAEVIDDYVREYHGGRTPSPCVRCNERVRFPHLLALADRVGADWVASGHYARVLENEGELYVGRGEDEHKDQSYFLYRLPASQLARIAFPLGESTKAQVREEARRRGLPVAATPDSQELCFVPDGDRSRVLGQGHGAGDIVDTTGQVLGQHRGVEFYTVGQRKGLGLGGGEPRYVLDLRAHANQVVVGDEAGLECWELTLGDAVLRDPLAGASGLIMKSRYRHRGCRVKSVTLGDASLHLALDEPDRAPAPGQAVVLYRDAAVVGGGRLLQSSSEARS